MSVARSLRYSCPPSESITLEDLKNFLNDAIVLEFEDGLVPHVTIQGGSDTSKVGRKFFRSSRVIDSEGGQLYLRERATLMFFSFSFVTSRNG